jgi:hypothetical protein
VQFQRDDLIHALFQNRRGHIQSLLRPRCQ